MCDTVVEVLSAMSHNEAIAMVIRSVIDFRVPKLEPS